MSVKRDQAFDEWFRSLETVPDTRAAFWAGWGARKKASYEEIYTPPPIKTLRDEFAIHIAGQFVRRAATDEDWGRIPTVSYALADAMLGARDD